MIKTINIYTDGSCLSNPGKGAYSAIIANHDNELILSGVKNDTTNNEMELLGALKGLLHAIEITKRKKDVEYVIYSDSAYVINTMTQKWYIGWERNGWLTSKKEPVKHKETWENLIELTKKYSIKFVKVKGHSGIHYNELADKTAKSRLR